MSSLDDLDSAPIPSTKCKLSTASTDVTPMCNIHTSAWRAPSSKISYVRNPLMVPCTFRRLVSSIEGPDITFVRSETIEMILIAEDWYEGWNKFLEKEDHFKSGYIGQGTSKHMVYV